MLIIKNILISSFFDLEKEASTTTTPFKDIFEQISYENDFEWKQNLTSTLRRASYCSLQFDGYLYVVGGYSFRKINLMSRLNLNSLKWEHSPDQNPSSIHNRSNRRFYSNLNFKQPSLNLPQNRYAHSCVLDKQNVRTFLKIGVYKT